MTILAHDEPRTDVPTGQVTFLFVDAVGSKATVPAQASTGRLPTELA